MAKAGLRLPPSSENGLSTNISSIQGSDLFSTVALAAESSLLRCSLKALSNVSNDETSNDSSLVTLDCADLLSTSNELGHIYYALYGVLMTIFISFGIFGNIMNIVVFYSPKLWACLNYYLIALAIWDLALLLTSLSLWSIWTLYFHGATPLAGSHASILRHAYVSGNISLTGCVWVIVTLTLERYIAILHPLKHRSMDNSSRAKIVLILVSLGVILFNSAKTFEIEVVDTSCCHRNSSKIEIIQQIRPTSLRSNNAVYFLVYRVFGNLLFVYLVPFCILALLTVHMCIALRRAKRQRRTMTILFDKVRLAAQICNGVTRSGSTVQESTLAQGKKKKKKNAVGANFKKMSSGNKCANGSNGCAAAPTVSKSEERKRKNFAKQLTRRLSFRAEATVNRMLSVVLVKFLLCYSLPVVNDILEVTLPQAAYNQANFVELVVICSNLLVVFNSSCNFFIYFITGRRFRTEFLHIIRNCSYQSSLNIGMGIVPVITPATAISATPGSQPLSRRPTGSIRRSGAASPSLRRPEQASTRRGREGSYQSLLNNPEPEAAPESRRDKAPAVEACQKDIKPSVTSLSAFAVSNNQTSLLISTKSCGELNIPVVTANGTTKVVEA